MPKLGRKLTEEELKNPENSIEYWREYIGKNGVELVIKRLEPPLRVSDFWPFFARQALEEHEKEYREQSVREQSSNTRAQRQREDDAVEIGREANSIARKANRETRNTWLVAFFVGVAIVSVTIWIALRP